MTLEEALAECPVLAIIRGVKPDEAVAVGEALYAAGIRGVEVPMNSPEPLDSIARLAKALGDRMVVGAGTVLRPSVVDQVMDAGGKIIVSPNTDVSVIRRSVELGLEALPGFATPTDAFAALGAGARHLKLFPAATYGPGHVKQVRAVLPPEAVVWAVGGVGAADMQAWWDVGVRAFGLGSELYKPGMSADDVARQARTVVEAAKVLKA